MKANFDRAGSCETALEAPIEAAGSNMPDAIGAPYLQAAAGPPPWFDPDDAAFTIRGPSVKAVPVLFASPHSGRRLPEDMTAATRWSVQKLSDKLGRLEDRYVDEIFADAPAHGATLLTALVHRAYIDLNREPYELDPSMFAEALPNHANTRSPRVTAGLGAIARAVGDSGDIYGRKLTLRELEHRLDRVHRPYHQVVGDFLSDLKSQFGQAVLLDCHSMPSAGMKRPAEIVLGDRFGASCAPWLIDLAQTTLENMGFVVARNAPYAGGYVTQAHGAPQRGIHALQVELRRDLYMDEQFLVKSSSFQEIKLAMSDFAGTLCSAVQARAAPKAA